MINRTIAIVMFVGILQVTSATQNPTNHNRTTDLVTSRQSPETPYFDAVVYPHAWSWALTALVLVVFKSFGLFVAFAMWAYWEQRIRGKPSFGRSGQLDDWMDLAVRYLADGQSEYCRKRLACEVGEYTRNVPLVGRVELGGVWSKSEEECSGIADRSGSCSLTIGDFFLRKIGWTSDQRGVSDEMN
ncbi:hypothetical protein quinque_005209 [Culex quinquefasciatus]